MGRKHPRPYFQRNVTKNRLHEANMQITSDRLHSTMKQAVCHRRIQQRSDNTSMKDVVISLEFSVCLELRPDDAITYGLERQIQ